MHDNDREARNLAAMHGRDWNDCGAYERQAFATEAARIQDDKVAQWVHVARMFQVEWLRYATPAAKTARDAALVNARCAAARRDRLDTTSSASRQHFIDTGRYLSRDEPEQTP